MSIQMKGNTYIIKSIFFTENIYKIGKTTCNSDEIKSAYSRSYGVADLKQFEQSKNCGLAETMTHKLLDKYRLRNPDTGRSTELFKGDIELFKLVVTNVCDHINNNMYNDMRGHLIYDYSVNNFTNDYDQLNNKFTELATKNNAIKTRLKKPKKFKPQSDKKYLFTCGACDKGFTRTRDYKRHINRLNPCTQSQLTYKCPNCSKMFSYESKLNEHYHPKSRCYMKHLQTQNIQLKLACTTHNN